MEMRLFDAPLDHFESAMQMKLVRALLNTALNGTGDLPEVRGFEYEKMAGDYECHTRVERMCRQIGLEAGNLNFSRRLCHKYHLVFSSL